MAHSHINEHMMQVGLVGLKRTFAFGHAHSHHAQGIEDRYGKDSQRKGYEVNAIGIAVISNRTVLTEHTHHEPCYQNAHHHRAGITNEHP